MNVFLSQIYGSAFTAHCVEKFNHNITMVKKVLSKPAAVCLHWWKGEKNSALCNSECQDIFFFGFCSRVVIGMLHHDMLDKATERK